MLLEWRYIDEEGNSITITPLPAIHFLLQIQISLSTDTELSTTP